MKKQTNQSGDQEEETIAISDLLKIQDNLKKDLDLSKTKDNLTTEEGAKRAIYDALDEVIEKNVGSETKKEIDDARNEMDFIDKFKANLNKISDLGKEIEKNLVWQLGYLTNHFDKSEKNVFKIAIDRAITNLVEDKNAGFLDRLEQAKKILNVIKIYREDIVAEVSKRQEIVSALMPSIENAYQSIDFDWYGREHTDVADAKALKNLISTWIDLTKELVFSRKKAIDAMNEQLDMDEMLPKIVVDNGGDISQNISGADMLAKGERMVRLINEASEQEDIIQDKRKALTKELLGEQNYLETPNTEEVQTNPSEKKLLLEKPWFRLLKVVYIAAYLIGLLIAFTLMSEDDFGFFALIAVVVFFTLIKKAFYYIVFGKTSIN